MSIRIMSKVWDSAPYTDGTLVLLLALADWANDDGLCWPKVSQMQIKARLSRSGVQFAMRRLFRDGAVVVIKEASGTSCRHYQIGAQYLSPRGSVTAQGGLSNWTRNKEEPSLEATVKIPSSIVERNRKEREANLAAAKKRGLA